jgi:hypothetical protein
LNGETIIRTTFEHDGQDGVEGDHRNSDLKCPLTLAYFHSFNAKFRSHSAILDLVALQRPVVVSVIVKQGVVVDFLSERSKREKLIQSPRTTLASTGRQH